MKSRSPKKFARLAWRLIQQYGPQTVWDKTWLILRREGLHGIFQRILVGIKGDGYGDWINRNDTLTDVQKSNMSLLVESFEVKPLISVVMPVFNPPPQFLEEAIQSVKRQIYPHWELCIADDCSTDPAIRQILESQQQEDSRIHVAYRKENGHISQASNTALALASGEYVALLDHDDTLPEHALFWVVEAINQHPNVKLIYSDEDKIDETGDRFDPYFKCDLNYELLLAQNMISHLGVYDRSVLSEIGGFRIGFEGSQDYDLALRVLEHIKPSQVVHIPRVLYHWRAIVGSVARSPDQKDYPLHAMRKAVSEHLQRCGVDAEVLPAPEAPNYNRVRFARPDPLPMVSIIIPTRDQAGLLGKCIDSIIAHSTYSNYEIIIIDNGSIEPATHALFGRLSSDRVRVERDDSPFNFSKLNNHGVRLARGELVCLLNNDIEIITPDWLEEMVSFAVQPEIGCVGARLWYPNGRLQHGGVIIGIGGVAGHAHMHLPRGKPGYRGRAVLHQTFSAVTAACLVIRRETFNQLGGLDEAFPIQFNDVDFCLRVREAGYRNVWTPYAEMIHHESASRGDDLSPEQVQRSSREIELMKSRWGAMLNYDPAYSPNLMADTRDVGFSLSH